MHQFKCSGSPYLCEITLDLDREFCASDLSSFKNKNERGVAVYGHTPNVLFLAKGQYQYWASIGDLLSILNAGKVALCGSEIAESTLEYLRRVNPNVQVVFCDEPQKTRARSWLLA